MKDLLYLIKWVAIDWMNGLDYKNKTSHADGFTTVPIEESNLVRMNDIRDVYFFFSLKSSLFKLDIAPTQIPKMRYLEKLLEFRRRIDPWI